VATRLLDLNPKAGKLFLLRKNSLSIQKTTQAEKKLKI
jgi:hypothetical protein